MKKQSGTLKVEPKWIELYPIFEDMILHGNESNKKFVCSELKKLCIFVDSINKVIE